ncbi:MAG: sel1 repeat family protein [Pseudomonadota bacterium]
MTVCEGTVCRDVPIGTTTFDPATAVPDEDPEGRLPLLIAEAEADPRAAYDLGMRYMRGDGIRRNPYQAIQWMRDAGERGDRRAQAALGRIYLTGLEEQGPDYQEAVQWLELASAAGDRESTRLLNDARELRANEDRFQTALARWRQAYTYGYWYRSRYYGYWRTGYAGYYYY